MTNSNRKKRLIEVALPLEKVSEESQSEKYRSYGRLSNLHRWWAVRPLSASRVAAYASLVSAPETDEEIGEELDLVSDLSEWENMHNDRILERAWDNISEEFDGEQPKVLDPFGGAGTMPLEAKRLGLDSHSVEYNPVAYLIELGVLNYPEVGQEGGDQSLGDKAITITDEDSKLIKGLMKWAEEVSESVENKLPQLYDDDELAYIWARTLPCPSPGCDLDIPLIKSFWLADRDSSDKVIYDMNCETNGSVNVQIYNENEFDEFKDGNKRKIRIDQADKVIDPNDGTVQRGSVSCPACGNSFKSKKSRELARNQGFGHRLMIVGEKDEGGGKKYRLPDQEDFNNIENAESELEKIDDRWVPDEEIPLHESSSRYLTPVTYGIETWGELFNPRQRLVLSYFVREINSVYDEIAEKEDEEYAQAVTTYLGLALDKMADYNSTLVAWQKGGEKGKNTYTRSALPIRWDYAESNPFGEGNSGSWEAALDLLPRAIKTASGTLGDATVNLGDATQLPYPDNHFDAVLTDPPYYDNVPYASLSDFFYVWLKRSLGDLYPNELSTPLTPKSNEIIEDKSKHSEDTDAEIFFEEMLSKAFSEMSRVLKEDGITTIVFAHKSSEAWAQMIRGLLNSGLVVTATWPIHTEKRNRVRSIGSASLASSVYFVCRNRSGSEIGYYSDVEEELENRVHERLDYFWQEGIRGADLLVSAIGPATEVFGQYESVKRLSGDKVTADELLEHTQRLVSDYALEKVLEEDVELGAIDPETRFYILYRWAFANQKEDYDEIRKLAQVNNANVDQLERMNILEVTRGDGRLQPPQDRTIEDPAKVPESNNLPLVDKIHRAVVLWESGDRDALKSFVEEHCMSEEFWRSAQAIAECLPEKESKSQKEKQMLHGLLGYGGQTDFEGTGQSKLEKYTDGGQEE